MTVRTALASVIVLAAASRLAIHAQTALPPGAVSLVDQDRFGSRIALCAQTGGQAIRQGARNIVPTAVWAGESADVHKLNAGVGACDPAWSPDGRWLAVTAADGLWIFPAQSSNGTLRVESKVPMGEPIEYAYRAFSHPHWSPDGALVGLLVTNGGTSWVEVFEALTGKLFYTSPPEAYSFSWGSTSRQLKVGDLDVLFPEHQ